MQIDYLVLADAATAADGKLYIHGAGWDRINASTFPVAHPMVAVAVRLRVPWNDTNQPHKVQLDIIDSDGSSILPAPPGPPGGEINVGRPPTIPNGGDQVVPLAFNLIGTTFQRAGDYVVVFRIDGVDAARSPFSVVQVQPPSGTPAP